MDREIKGPMRTGIQWSGALAMGYGGMIVLLSIIPDAEKSRSVLSWVSPRLQDLLHIPAYGLLTLLWVFALRDYGFGDRRSVGYAIGLAAGLGIVLEWIQFVIPGRYPSALDLIFNLTGVVSTAAGYRICIRRSSSGVITMNSVAGESPLPPAAPDGRG